MKSRPTPRKEVKPCLLIRLWHKVKKHVRCYGAADLDGDGELDIEMGWTGKEAEYSVSVENEVKEFEKNPEPKPVALD